MISPKAFRQHIKPRLRQLFAGIKACSPHIKILLHSDGAILPILPDLIEIGLDILNPVQVSAKGMSDTGFLKREFGRDLVFWGAIDTQHVLPYGTPNDVRAEVCKRTDDLAPGGGYILASVHNIQGVFPPKISFPCYMPGPFTGNPTHFPNTHKITIKSYFPGLNGTGISLLRVRDFFVLRIKRINEHFIPPKGDLQLCG